MSESFKLACAFFLVAMLSAILGLMVGWRLMASDACYDAGGVWRSEGGVCVGLVIQP